MFNEKNEILIIDDSKTALTITSELLSDNYKAHTALDIKHGLEILENNSISLIILDLIMPDIDGYKACEIIKSNKDFKEIPIIFATSKTDEESLEKAFKVGGVDYITKPVRQLELLARINTHLEINNQKNELKFKNKQIEEYLKQQTKMAMMGQMITNIVHQWRQPLNYLTTSASSLIIKNDMKMLKEEDIDEAMKTMLNKVNFLSETIDTFRNFIHDDKESVDINVQNILKNSIDLSYTFIKDNFIELKTDIIEEELIINAPLGELTQVIVNLLNNSKDALLENKIKNPWIKLTLEKLDNKAIIHVEDNAGGIPDKIYDKIFEANFTTKGKNGTGIGLYMSKQIIDESLNGTINFKNTPDGVKFTLEIPTIK